MISVALALHASGPKTPEVNLRSAGHDAIDILSSVAGDVSRLGWKTEQWRGARRELTHAGKYAAHKSYDGHLDNWLDGREDYCSFQAVKPSVFREFLPYSFTGSMDHFQCLSPMQADRPSPIVIRESDIFA